MTSLDTCTSSHPRVVAGLLTVLVFSLSGCGLLSIDPDEIDVADDDEADEVGEAEDTAGDDAVDTGNGTDTGEGDAESTGSEGADDDAEQGSDTDFDTDDGTSTNSTGTTDDGETGDPICEISDNVVVVGDNDVMVAADASTFEGSCGGSEGETPYSFTAEVAGDHQFSLVGAEFEGILYLIDVDCAEIADTCVTSEDSFTRSLQAGEMVLLVVDSEGGAGAATLVITGP